MKKFISVLISLIIIGTIPLSAYASDDIKVFVDGKFIEFDVPPQIINGRTMVPVRAIFEAVGAKVDWNQLTRTVLAEKNSTYVTMFLNNKFFYINSSLITMDVSPIAIDGRVLAPARYVGESFGYNVTWDEALNSVFMTSSDTNVLNYPSSELPDFGSATGIKKSYSEKTKEDDGTFTYAYKYDVPASALSGEYMLDNYIHHILASGWKTDGVKYKNDESNVAYYLFKKEYSDAMLAVQVSEGSDKISVWIIYTSLTDV